jgi:hypothetical protein
VQQQKMAESQKAMIARQLEMQQAMRERMVATQIAIARDMFKFYGAFFALAAVGLSAAAMKKRAPQFAVPLVPLSFVLAYQYDMAYNGKMERVIAEAEHILEHERALLALPGPPLTIATLDTAIIARQQQSDNALAAAKPRLQ